MSGNAEAETRPGTVKVRGEVVMQDRESKGWNQDDLAVLANVSDCTVKRVEKGGRCHLFTISAIAEALGHEGDVKRYIAEDRVVADEVRPAPGSGDAQAEQRRKERALQLACEWAAMTAEHRAAIEERMPGSVAHDKPVVRSWLTPKRAERIYRSRLGQKSQREDAELRLHILELLNVFETIATTFRHHAVGRAMVEEQFRATLVRWKNILAPFIKVAWDNYRESEGLPWEPYVELVDSYWLKKPRPVLIPTAELLNRPTP
jgi:transcriptional regulator with XRE-family HTH domain